MFDGERENGWEFEVNTKRLMWITFYVVATLSMHVTYAPEFREVLLLSSHHIQNNGIEFFHLNQIFSIESSIVYVIIRMCQWHIVLNMYVINILSSTVCITSAFTVQIRKSMFTFYSSNPENGKHFSFANERKATVIEKNRNDHWIRFPVKEVINHTGMSWMKKTSGHTTIDLIKLCWIHTYTHTRVHTYTH